MRRTTAQAPTRIDFGGGWTDVPPYPAEQEGFVCNLAIARHAHATITPPLPGRSRQDDAADGALARAVLARAGVPLALMLRSDFPVGAGLGGSSAAGVAALAALAAWKGDAGDRGAIAEESRAIEVEELGIAGGRQDHYAAAYGGALALTFGESVGVERIPLAPETAAELERRCVVLYTGQSRISGDTIRGVLDAYRARAPHVVDALARMKTLARAMAGAIARGTVDELGALVGEHWAHQRSLHPGITTERIDAIMTRASQAGMLGGKALGASGGGCVLLVAPAGGAERVRAAVAGLAEPLDFTIDHEGVRVVTED